MSESFERLATALADRYEIERELGEGGMATVYLAKDIKHERKVALKVLRPELAATLGTDRFLQEVRVTANLQHPHILPLFDSGEADGFLYYVMPYLEGESLRERVAREGELPVGEAVKILREVVDALAAAHQMGVVHRDIKPDNVMLSGRHAVVADFGVAKAVTEATGRHQLTTKGVALGTPAYMAPEQAAANEHIDHRADIYAVGAMGYELLAGRPPFSGMTAQQVLAAHVTEAPRAVTEHRGSVPQGLGDVLMRCLEKKPADRWQTAEELLQQLEVYATTPTTGITPTQMTPARVAGGISAWIRGAAVVSILGFGAWALWGRTEDGTRATEETQAGAEGPVFVVAPFENQSGLDTLDSFGNILSDYLTGQIDRNDIAIVTPSSAVRSLAAERDPTVDPVVYYGTATGARYVITGSYFSQGGDLVVQAEVTEAETGNLVTTVEPTQSPASDYMAAAQASTERILGVAARLLNPDMVAPGIAGQPRSWLAYQYFESGLELGNAGNRQEGLVQMYRAIEADSTFAEALVVASVWEWQTGTIVRADSLARMAVRYRDDLTRYDALQVDWILAWLEGDREEALRLGLALEELEPPFGRACRDAASTFHLSVAVEVCIRTVELVGDRPASFNYGWADLLTALHALGDYESELEWARRRQEGFPDRFASYASVIRALVALDRLDEAQEVLAEVQARWEDEDWSLGFMQRSMAQSLFAHAHGELGDEIIARSVAWYEDEAPRGGGHAQSLYTAGAHAEALAIYEGLLGDDPENHNLVGWVGAAAAKLGDRARALEMSERLEELEARLDRIGTPTRYRAAIAASLGDLDEAVRLLEESYALGAVFTTALRHGPLFEDVQGYPPFERFIAPRD